MKDKKKSRGGKPIVAVIDNTTPYDTLTLKEWHAFRDEERERMDLEKEQG
tara:strand:+ start:533 stop:682 length:150 start_codon:yes stop_codon:yes gene_type:complete